MADYERYNTRNVAQKEIYDSYMGILRISPNDINDSDVDDPTQILNTLYDEEKKQRTKIILSDSDGNVLPITFQPRAFTTQNTLYRDPITGIDSIKDEEDILHIATIINEGKGYVFASHNFTNRGSLFIEKDDSVDSRHSSLRVLSGGKTSSSIKEKRGEGWLLYPTESPNDDNYFNSKNKHKLFDESDTTTPRYKQVEDSLYKWTAEKHSSQIGNSERVIVTGRYVNQTNQFNEEIPVYYTRDYILGHYDGHQVNTDVKNNMFQRWGINGKNDIGFTDNVTKLSWTRLDKLIWESLDEILSGHVRHHKGRYTELGVKESAFPGILDKLGIEGNEYKNNAPILGTEMARGTIMYHAMPFHRYWYHRTRQALRGLIERKKGSPDVDLSEYQEYETDENGVVTQITLDKWILNKGLSINDENDTFEKDLITDFTETISDENADDDDENVNYNLIHDEISKLQTFYENNLITPCSKGTVGFVHSLAKNFVLCNGRHVNFANFPNLSLTNEVIFDTTRIYTTTVNDLDELSLSATESIIKIEETKNSDSSESTDTNEENDNIEVVNDQEQDDNNEDIEQDDNNEEENDTSTARYTVTIKDVGIGNSSSYDPINGFVINTKITGILKALIKSSNSSKSNIKLPNLFALFESTPRFIRGLNWKVSNSPNPVDVYNSIIDNDSETNKYVSESLKTNADYMDICNVSNSKNVYKLQKEFNTTDLPHFHTYDHYVVKETHQHTMFSNIEGGVEEDEENNKKYISHLLHIYHCDNTRGGHVHHKNHMMTDNMMNFDRVYSKLNLFHSPGSYNFGFYSEVADNWKDKDFFNYNFKDIYKGKTFLGFTPIPNLGLFAFNASIFNNKGEADDFKQRGTLKEIETLSEDTSDANQLYYVDGEGGKHFLYEAKITPEGEESDIFNNDDIFNKELSNITITYTGHKNEQDSDTENVDTDLITQNSNAIKAHDAEKQRRKFMAMKMNEAEGFIPISYCGKASGRVIFGWSRSERSGWKSSSRNTYHDNKYNVASYIMCIPPTSITVDDNSPWRCWSSISYFNPNKLGVGKVENYINNRQDFNEDTDYYDVNSVTQLPSSEKYKKYKYGGVGVIVDETCPTPAYQNLLPLIRI